MQNDNKQTEFSKAIERGVTCDICGQKMYPIHGGGWDYDRMICPDRGCGAEIVYPSTTVVKDDSNKKKG